MAQEALGQRQEFSKLTGAFYQAGKVTNLDHVRAQSQVSEAEQAVVEAQNGVRLAKEILGRTLGLKEQVQVDIKGNLPQALTAAGDLNSLWQEVLKKNPEIKKLDLDIAQSQTLIKVAAGRFFPGSQFAGRKRREASGPGRFKAGMDRRGVYGVPLLRGRPDQGPGGQGWLHSSAVAGKKA